MTVVEMREIKTTEITEIVAKLCKEANYYLPQDVMDALKQGLNKEESEVGKAIFHQLIENAEIAKQDDVPICQDTGFTVVFLELGQEVSIVGGELYSAIEEGVRQGYTEGYLRKSILKDPIRGENTGDNTPAVIYTDVVPGDKLKIIIAPKGGGSENMSEVWMGTPAAGAEGVKNFVVERVRKSGGNPCPPIVVGVGIGGTFDKCAQLAKRALLRPIGSDNKDPFYIDMEKELLSRINNLGIGPGGLGGRITALAVHIEVFPRHIATFPVAVNIQCHACRHKEAII